MTSMSSRQITVRVKAKTTPAQAKELLQKTPGIVKLDHVFPKDIDAFLNSMYVLEVESELPAIQYLETLSEVIYVQCVVPRKF